MTFKALYESKFSVELAGSELAGLYVSLSAAEERLDRNQRQALDRLRFILYENLSVEELEGLPGLYAVNSGSEERV
ncbi:MAG TPA: hypothetical protein P5298_02775 [Spirochaetia bacterium]|nr:hypothetical protein [Spirochaetaceae bacterium]HPE87900.1 hypothetical protein [Spirochaetales bacterium]HRW23313.1 hypothetical protein [Spirochaetia bacterium]